MEMSPGRRYLKQGRRSQRSIYDPASSERTHLFTIDRPGRQIEKLGDEGAPVHVCRVCGTKGFSGDASQQRAVGDTAKQ